MNEQRILHILRSPLATLVVLSLALIAQLPHAADVFRLIVQGEDVAARLHSYSYAVALELAVLLFVVQHRQAESYGFAVVSIAMNLSYYHLHKVNLLSSSALPALLVSVALPVAIARYSHAVAGVVVHPVKPKPAQSQLTEKLQETHSKVTVDVQPDDAPAPSDDGTIDKRQRAMQMRSEGLSIAQIARDLNVHRNTAAGWLKHTNGVQP